MPRFRLSTIRAYGVRLLALCLCWGASSIARAEKEQFGYDFSLSGSYSLLSGSGSMGQSTLPGNMVNMRNNPWLKLTNTSADATLDRFVMSIGDERFNFSDFKIGTQIGTFDIDVNIIDGGNNLELVFTNFNPGETVFVRFQLRPDNPDAYQFPDFQNVLFDANGNSSADNSVLTAAFTDPVADQELTLTDQLPDFVVAASATTSNCYFCSCVPMNGTMAVYNFSQSDSLDPNVPEIPEPSAWVLMLLGAVGLTAGSKVVRMRRTGTAFSRLS